MRPGTATGTLVEIPRGVRAVQEWAQPFAGRLEEEYTLRDDGKMSVVSKICVGDRSAEVLQVTPALLLLAMIARCMPAGTDTAARCTAAHQSHLQHCWR
jgi:hypothetical protein